MGQSCLEICGLSAFDRREMKFEFEKLKIHKERYEHSNYLNARGFGHDGIYCRQLGVFLNFEDRQG